jgi:hypothetical protein
MWEHCYPLCQFVLSIISMRAINQTHLTQRHRGKWVALKSDRRTVVAAGDSVKSVVGAARRKGCNVPIVTRVPKTQAHFIGYFLAA